MHTIFDELHLGERFLSGGKLYEKTGDSSARGFEPGDRYIAIPAFLEVEVVS